MFISKHFRVCRHFDFWGRDKQFQGGKSGSATVRVLPNSAASTMGVGDMKDIDTDRGRHGERREGKVTMQ